MNLRKTAQKVLNMHMVFFAMIIFQKGLSVITGTESSFVFVVSGSMSPTFNRGDLLFLTLAKNKPVQINSICVYKKPGASSLIVHRVMEVHQSNETKKEHILTKGDHNTVSDREFLYGKGVMWIDKESIIGIVRGYVPYIGIFAVWMYEYPWLKVVVFSSFALTILMG